MFHVRAIRGATARCVGGSYAAVRTVWGSSSAYMKSFKEIAAKEDMSKSEARILIRPVREMSIAKHRCLDRIGKLRRLKVQLQKHRAKQYPQKRLRMQRLYASIGGLRKALQRKARSKRVYERVIERARCQRNQTVKQAKRKRMQARKVVERKKKSFIRVKASLRQRTKALRKLTQTAWRKKSLSKLKKRFRLSQRAHKDSIRKMAKSKLKSEREISKLTVALKQKRRVNKSTQVRLQKACVRAKGRARKAALRVKKVIRLINRHTLMQLKVKQELRSCWSKYRELNQSLRLLKGHWKLREAMQMVGYKEKKKKRRKP